MSINKLEQIDPALALLNAFSKISLGTSQKIQQMRQEVIFNNGTISAKMKALVAMVVGINERCEPCLSYYALQAKSFGATEAELGEILAVIVTMSGCVGEMWALKAYKTFINDTNRSSTCCEH